MTQLLLTAAAGLLFLAALSQWSFGSAMMPCLRAASSKNANFVVVVERQEGSREISLQVFPREKWATEKTNYRHPGQTGPIFMRWNVTFDPQKMMWGRPGSRRIHQSYFVQRSTMAGAP